MSTEKTIDMSLDASTVATLSKITTATITTILLKKGLRNTWMRNTKPLRPDLPRIVGRAFTLRFVPWREDLATPESWSSPISTRAAIEAMPAGCVAVADAMGEADAGIFGDILCARMVKKERRRPRHRRRRARRLGRPRHWAAGVVSGWRGAAVGRPLDVRRLAAADRLRRRRGVPR